MREENESKEKEREGELEGLVGEHTGNLTQLNWILKTIKRERLGPWGGKECSIATGKNINTLDTEEKGLGGVVAKE